MSRFDSSTLKKKQKCFTLIERIILITNRHYYDARCDITYFIATLQCRAIGKNATRYETTNANYQLPYSHRTTRTRRRRVKREKDAELYRGVRAISRSSRKYRRERGRAGETRGARGNAKRYRVGDRCAIAPGVADAKCRVRTHRAWKRKSSYFGY